FWKLLLRQPPKGNILHIGTDDWGKTALDLRNSANKITYLDFDCNNWRMKAVQLRLKEAMINNTEFILWDKEKALPFIKDTFDLIVINGFLDDDEILPEKYSFIKRITGEIYPILKKDGELFLSTDNKWYQSGYNSYRELLSKAGFKDLGFWSAIPDYRNFNYIIPLDNYAVLRYWIHQIDSHTFRNKIRSMGLYLCLNIGILKYVVPNFCITAYK
ncbi:MAG: class I SAM-dependent methyltransferase, partial [Planctomycetota bacterium]